MPWMQAAVDRPFGFRPYGNVESVGSYNKDASAAAIFPGDLVIQEADGGIAPAGASATDIIGVAAEHSPASTAKTDFQVYDHPGQRFFVQDDSDATHMTEAEVGLNVNIIATAGNPDTLQSRQEIDSSSAATTATLPIKVWAQHPVENRSFATAVGSPRKWIVSINQHIRSGHEVLGV